MRKLAASLGILAAVTGTMLAAQPASAAVHVRECWGSNRGDWDAFHAAVPASHCVRVYYDQTDVFPRTWPQRAGPGTWTMLSIRPGYAQLMDGSLDTQIRDLALSAPAHSRLTIDHENAGGNPLGYPPSVHNPAHYVAMQQHMEALVQGTHVRFGVVIIAPFGSVLNWIYKGDDWFGYDFYAFSRYLNRNGTINPAAVTARMTANLRVLQKFTGRRYPPIALGETNASRNFQRKTWFSLLASWFAARDGHRMAWILTRWTAKTGPHFGLSGPWPPSQQVVALLHHLAWTYR